MFYSDVLALPIFKQEEPQLSPENGARLPPLQYVLCAATSPAVKLHEETLTYLNQGRGLLRVVTWVQGTSGIVSRGCARPMISVGNRTTEN